MLSHPLRNNINHQHTKNHRTPRRNRPLPPSLPPSLPPFSVYHNLSLLLLNNFPPSSSPSCLQSDNNVLHIPTLGQVIDGLGSEVFRARH
jgi:hypothetical protein